MKNIIILVLLAVASLGLKAQSVQITRDPGTPTVRPELVFSSTKTGGAATDTITSNIVSLKGTLYSAVATQAADTVHRFTGYITVTGDTCTYTLQVQELSPEGIPFAPGLWTTVAKGGAQLQYIPNRASEVWHNVNLSVHFVRFRLFRAQGATQSVSNSLFQLFLYRY